MRLIKIARPCLWPVLAMCLILGASTALAQPPLRFRESVFRGGELRHIGGFPVLIVQGAPEEMGEQAAALTHDAATPLLGIPLAMGIASGRWGQRQQDLQRLLERCPADHRKELESFARQANMQGAQRNLLVGLNMLFDMYAGLGCSSLVVEGSRSATRTPIFGRNLDMPHQGLLTDYSLVVVYRPNGKHAFVSIGFPGVLGVFSGMNAQGLALAVHGVFAAPDGSPAFNPNGAPSGFVFRKILEECATVSGAEKVLRNTEFVTSLSVVLCDRQGGAVVELTPRSSGVRRGDGGICICTNHFRAIGRYGGCPRYSRLLNRTRINRTGNSTLGVRDVAERLHEVHQGAMTLQTMIFEPQPLRLHLSIGSCPSSAQPPRVLELSELLATTSSR